MFRFVGAVRQLYSAQKCIYNKFVGFHRFRLSSIQNQKMFAPKVFSVEHSAGLWLTVVSCGVFLGVLSLFIHAVYERRRRKQFRRRIEESRRSRENHRQQGMMDEEFFLDFLGGLIQSEEGYNNNNNSALEQPLLNTAEQDTAGAEARPTAPSLAESDLSDGSLGSGYEDHPLAYKCPICTSTIAHLHVIPCGHAFHQKCIHKALDSKGECPICRTHTKKEDIKPVFG